MVLYDGECPVCTRQARSLSHFARRRIEARPYQSFSSTDPRLSRAELDRELKLVTPDGGVFGGAEAIVRAARLARPALGWVLSVYYVPGLRQVADRLYSWVARNRYRLFGRSGPAVCSDDTCGNFRR